MDENGDDGNIEGPGATVHILITSTDALDEHFRNILDLEEVEQAAAVDAIILKGKSKAEIKAMFKKFQASGRLSASALKTVEEAREWMLRTWYQYQGGGGVKVCRFVCVEASGDTPEHMRMDRYSYRDFRDITADLPELAMDTSAAYWWQRNPDKMVAYGVTLDESLPGGALIGKSINMWWGLASPVATSDPVFIPSVKLFLRHLWSLCGGQDAPEFHYLLNWLAWAVQNPMKTIGTAIVLRGEPGAGKGLLFTTLMGIFKTHGHRFNRREEIVGRFNYLIEGCALACLEEATWAGSRADAERLKSMITDPTTIIERKYEDSVEVRNITKFISATNAEWAVSVDHNDRRWVVIETPEPTLTKDEFNVLATAVKSRAYHGAVLTYLKSIDVSGWSAERERPRTAGLAKQKAASLHEDSLWWRLVVENGTWAVGGRSVENPQIVAGPLWVLKSSVYSLYVQWHWDTRQKGAPVPLRMFWANAKRWFPDVDFEGPRPRLDHGRGTTVRIPSDLFELAEPFFGWLDKGYQPHRSG